MALKRKEQGLFIILFLFILNIFAWIEIYNLRKVGTEVMFFDVGQGDSIFIETQNKHQVLIDGGPNSAILKKLAKEMPFYDRTLDLVILSHPEKDHFTGLIEVLKRYKVDNIMWTGVVRETAEWKEWNALIKKEGARVVIAQAGKKVLFPKTNSHIDILYPFLNFEGKKIKDSNNTSIVAKFFAPGNNNFVFTGDIEKEGEENLVNSDLDITATVLKIAHHGSKTSSSEDFLEKVSPELAVISAGRDNKYGHPHSEVLANLAKFGIQVKRTDKDGDIKFIIKDNNLYYETSQRRENGINY